MCGRKSYKRFAGLGAAIVLFAGLGVAIVLFSGRPGDQRMAKPITADLVTAIRNADAQAVRKLLENEERTARRGFARLSLAALAAAPLECRTGGGQVHAEQARADPGQEPGDAGGPEQVTDGVGDRGV